MTEPSRASVAAVILAAGASTRMGRPKQVLSFDGQPMVRRVAAQALASAASPVLVVVGANAALVRSALQELPVELVWNPGWEEGQGSSVRIAAQRLAERGREVDAAIFLLADQPLVTAASIEALIGVQQKTGAAIVATDRAGALGVPALFSSRYFDELARLRGEGGARSVIASHREEAVGVHLPEAEVDVDTPEDYEHLTQAGAGRSEDL